MKYFIRRIIAHRLDKNPDYCWANLVTWMIGHNSLFSILPWHIDNDYKRKVCTKKTGFYCGKCEKINPIK